ncbi:MAG: ArsR family transcriptional regulator, partial [Candidatus Bathyarchaeota archaeon]|nr:ArsR family transcriptional regulator [Candidatus Bathyarchaeota archaeon]
MTAPIKPEIPRKFRCSMTQTDHMATLPRRESGEVGKRRAKDAVLFVMKRLMEGPAYPRDLQRDLGFSRGTIRYHLN